MRRNGGNSDESCPPGDVAERDMRTRDRGKNIDAFTFTSPGLRVSSTGEVTAVIHRENGCRVFAEEE